VEGYTDVVSLHQAGVENVVASGGTSLTLDQLRLVKKYTKNLTIIYDGDTAGVKAALRGLDLALEEGLNVKLVLIPDGEDPDSYVRKAGHEEFKKFIASHKKDVVLFQLDVLLKDAGDDSAKKAELVNGIAETISKIDRTEDFSKQQEYIRQTAQILKIDEAGFTTLVNKFIRNRISVVEKKLPFNEAKQLADNAAGTEANFDDQTFNLLYKDELQEREIAKVLLEHGAKPWTDNETIAAYVLSEMPDDDLIDNKTVAQLIQIYKESGQQNTIPDKTFFIYHQDSSLSTLAVSLLHFPYEQSPRWRRDLSQSAGFQKRLFEQDAKSFYTTISRENEEELSRYLKVGSDNTMEQVASAINYLKLRKIKRLLLQNHADLEKAEPSRIMALMLTHQHLKSMEMELTKKVGAVVF
jgi:DNA primase